MPIWFFSLVTCAIMPRCQKKNRNDFCENCRYYPCYVFILVDPSFVKASFLFFFPSNSKRLKFKTQAIQVSESFYSKTLDLVSLKWRSYKFFDSESRFFLLHPCDLNRESIKLSKKIMSPFYYDSQRIHNPYFDYLFMQA